VARYPHEHRDADGRQPLSTGRWETGARILAAVSAISAVAASLTWLIDKDTSDPGPRPTPSIVSPTPIVPASPRVSLGRCGEWEFALRAAAQVYVDEPFDIKLEWSRHRPPATGQDTDPVCRFAAHLTFTSRSKVTTGPPPKVSDLGAGRRFTSSSFRWTGQASGLGPLRINALITGKDLATPISLTAASDVQPSRRVLAGEEWLAALTGSIKLEIKPQGALTRGRKTTLFARLTAPDIGSPPPGMAATGAVEVCLEATGGANGDQSCVPAKILFAQPIVLERYLSVTPVNTDPVTVAATATFRGTIDGTEVGGFSSVRAETAGSKPSVAGWDIAKSTALVSKEVLLTVAAVIAALGAIGFVWRRKRKPSPVPESGEDSTSPAPAVPEEAASAPRPAKPAPAQRPASRPPRG
jgi:hypothetical protein